MKVIIARLQQDQKQTLGILSVFKGLNKAFECKTLELADKGNQNFISCIPKGTYTCVPRYSQKYGHHYHITGVPNRDLILFHWGNFYTDIKGCVLVGKQFYDINRDGYKDVTSSKDTFKKMKYMIGRRSFQLTII
ncbi:DUF5675 family protein [Flammeovirga aprica]|uniref:DUF5675 domain-containing protein n=1 Tax=Flammeovirga aprica JL-4 TaxID=694437 RepID=A0A7X9RUL7_9BACT|nr:DUF5675 family protein [Flammeovirga aprica]NME69000.1 hypothetical protein [Flammeovirga aprica JL-4]